MQWNVHNDPVSSRLRRLEYLKRRRLPQGEECGSQDHNQDGGIKHGNLYFLIQLLASLSIVRQFFQYRIDFSLGS